MARMLIEQADDVLRVSIEGGDSKLVPDWNAVIRFWNQNVRAPTTLEEKVRTEPTKIDAIRTVRELRGLPLKQAKEWVEQHFPEDHWRDPI